MKDWQGWRKKERYVGVSEGYFLKQRVMERRRRKNTCIYIYIYMQGGNEVGRMIEGDEDIKRVRSTGRNWGKGRRKSCTTHKCIFLFFWCELRWGIGCAFTESRLTTSTNVRVVEHGSGHGELHHFFGSLFFISFGGILSTSNRNVFFLLLWIFLVCSLPLSLSEFFFIFCHHLPVERTQTDATEMWELRGWFGEQKCFINNFSHCFIRTFFSHSTRAHTRGWHPSVCSCNSK